MYTSRYILQFRAKIDKFLFLACAILTSVPGIISLFFSQVCLSYAVFKVCSVCFIATHRE